MIRSKHPIHNGAGLTGKAFLYHFLHLYFMEERHMRESISSKQTLTMRNIIHMYAESETGPARSNIRYGRMQAPLTLSIYRMREESGFYLLADRDGARSTTWSADTLAKLNVIAPLKQRYHSHDYFELIYVLEGQINEWIEEQCIRLKPGDCILLDKNIRHIEEYFDKDHTAACVFLAMDDECVRAMASSELPYENTQSILHFLLSHLNHEETTLKSFYHFRAVNSAVSSFSSAENELNAILMELTEKTPGFILMIQGHLRRLFGILEHPKEYEQLSAFNTIGRREEIIAQINLLMESSMGLLTKEELAERMNYNTAYLCRIIKSSLGKSFTQYRLLIRLKAAETLLIESRLSIVEICEKLRFSNRTYFYHAFETATGMTPQEFRDRKKISLSSSNS